MVSAPITNRSVPVKCPENAKAADELSPCFCTSVILAQAWPPKRNVRSSESVTFELSSKAKISPGTLRAVVPLSMMVPAPPLA